LYWNNSSIQLCGNLLEDSTAPIPQIYRIDPAFQGIDSVPLAASIQVAYRPHKTDLFQWNIPLEIIDCCSGILLEDSLMRKQRITAGEKGPAEKISK